MERVIQFYKKVLSYYIAQHQKTNYFSLSLYNLYSSTDIKSLILIGDHVLIYSHDSSDGQTIDITKRTNVLITTGA